MEARVKENGGSGSLAVKMAAPQPAPQDPLKARLAAFEQMKKNREKAEAEGLPIHGRAHQQRGNCTQAIIQGNFSFQALFPAYVP